MTEEQLRGLRGDFFAALSGGKRRTAHKIARVLYREAPGSERSRWRKWTEATRPGHRVVMMNYEVDVLAGDELAAVENARNFLGNDERVAEAVAKLGEEA